MNDFYSKKLQELETMGAKRSVKEIVQDGKFIFFEGKKLLNLSSNDYLGISADNSIKDNFLSQYKGKIQNPSARLLSGTNRVFFELENFISDFLQKEKTLLFNSGYHANVGIYSSLLNKEDVVFIDRLNHASIIDGIRLSGAKLIPFSHKNYDELEQKLSRYRANYKNSIISTEALFSMDGDFADIKRLISLKEKFNSLLIADEAHSFGVFGSGRGFCAEIGALFEVDIIMGTFGKAVGSYGAFAAGDRVLIDYLINFARPFIFSTTFPEISAAFSKYVLENYIVCGKLQKRLFELVSKCKSESYIIPIVTGSNDSAEALSKSLMQQGFYTLPIRYPTVKKGKERIRISINSKICSDEISNLQNYFQSALGLNIMS